MPHRSPTASDLVSFEFIFIGIPRISESKSKTVVDSVSGSQVVLVVVSVVVSTKKIINNLDEY